MKISILSVFAAMVFLAGANAEACNAFQKKQCQVNPKQCEEAGICQDAKAFNDEQFDKTASGPEMDMEEAASYGDSPSA